LLLVSSFAFGQGGNIVRQVVSGTVANGGSGQVIPYAVVRVCASTATGTPCSPLIADTYADPALTTSLGNPIAADANGFYSIFLPSGSYIIQESTPAGAGFTYSESFLIYVNGTGSVSSVDLALPSSVFLVTGGPITSSGTLTGAFIAQSANKVFGNCTGSSAVPDFCSITADMLPSTINATTVGGALTVTGAETVGGALGVTGATTLTSATLSTTLGVTGNTTLGGTLQVTGATTLLGTLGITSNASSGGYFTATGAITSSTSLIAPLANVTTGYQIGSSYGTAGYCLESTGTGTQFLAGCSMGGTPVLTLGSGAGSGSPSDSLTAGSLDRGGVISVTTGTTPSASQTIVTATFSTAFPTAAFCTVSPANNNAATLGSIIVGNAKTAFTIRANTVALTGATTYQWSYVCNGY
jgi:hypothetical protein